MRKEIKKRLSEYNHNYYITKIKPFIPQRFCINCNKLLIKNQVKFCSRKCRFAVYYQTKPVIKEYHKKWDKLNLENVRIRHKRYYEKYPEKKIAHAIFTHIPISKIQMCEDCNEREAEHRHHEDYSKPLEVKFLCRKCHNKIHCHPYIINPIKKLVLPLISLLLLISSVISQAVVQVPQDQTPKKTGLFSTTFSFFKSPIFWWIVIIVVIIIAILVGIFFLVKWLVQYFKERNDIFFKMKSERIKLSKIQKRYPSSKHFLKVSKNVPIRLVRKEEDGHLTITSPIAYHRGDYFSHEGNIIISMNLVGNKKFFLFPITSLLVIPNREKTEVFQKDKHGKVFNSIKDNLPKAKDIVQFNDGEILIFAESLSNVGQFYVPVLKTKDGKIVDLSMPTFQTLKEVVLTDFLYEQTDEFSKLAKKSMDLNPNLRYAIKSADNSQSVEIPQSTNK